MPPSSAATIEISKDYLHFNAAHFTLFSATEREDLHGHTFYVAATVTSPVGDDGLAFDYNLFKNALKALCDELDEKVLLPSRSPYLALEQDGGYLVARFADERIPFLPRDVLTLPVRNITVEELAPWLLSRLRAEPDVAALNLDRLELRVSSGPGQWAVASWTRDDAARDDSGGS
ncbi:MAG: 6-pyruvoyl tetrahydropterin synthase [Gammaproteobacteria bacterium]|nr:6-pyruvoyl tetrahydropterin synthase [Gammaproteobacteria bacterium]|tara:strand:- start:2739 stop:3263 length:525 start_codon:yes stop_codon:yes gene_type:complete